MRNLYVKFGGVLPTLVSQTLKSQSNEQLELGGKIGERWTKNCW